MPNDQAARASLLGCLSRALGIGPWSLIGHWSLVIGHWPRYTYALPRLPGFWLFAAGCLPCVASAGSTDGLTNEFVPELPKLWVRDVELRAAVGYKDNLLLSHTPTERVILARRRVDVLLSVGAWHRKHVNLLL